MKRTLLILSSLGLLCWIIEAVTLLLPSQLSQQLPDQQTISVVTSVIVVAMPFLGIADAVIGAIVAGQRRASRWLAVFVTLAIISMPALGIGFILGLLTAFPGNQNLTVVADALLLFPILIFLPGLIVALQHATQPAEMQRVA